MPLSYTPEFNPTSGVIPSKSLETSTGDKEVQGQVDLEGQSRRGLIVPLSAIYSRAGGDSTVVKLVGKKRTRVAVLVEATGDGVARVSPAKTSSIREGDVVKMGVK